MRPIDPDAFEKLAAARAERRARAISTIGLTILPPALLVLVIIAVLASPRVSPGSNRPLPKGALAGSAATATPTAMFPIPSTQVPFTPPTPAPPPFAFAAQWQNDSAAPGNVASVVFSPSAPQFGYLCVVNGAAPGGAPGGALAQSAAPHAAPAHPASGLPALFVTTHGGLAWSPLTGVPFGQPTNCRLTLDPDDPRSLYVIVDTPTGAQTGGSSSTLWHTPDGGQTWQEPSVPPVPGFSPVIHNLFFSGPRLVALVSGVSQGDGQPPTLLDASGDGGHTWKNITPALTLDGQPVSFNGSLLSMGATIIIGGIVASPGVIGASLAIPGGASTLTPALKRSRALPSGSSPGGPPPDTHYFASTDGGATWAPMTLPAHLSPSLTFTPSADGSTFYGAVTANQQDAAGQLISVPYITKDAGRTWTALPTLEGVAQGFLNTYTPGAEIGVSPAGAVLLQTFYTGENGVTPAGIFFLRDASATWQPLAYDPNVFGWLQLTSAPGDGRLWGIRVNPNTPTGGDLVYVDLP